MQKEEEIKQQVYKNAPDTTKPIGSKEQSGNEVFSFIIFLLATAGITIPLFIFLSKCLPDPDWFWNVDRILLFIATLSVVVLIIKNWGLLVRLDKDDKLSILGIIVALILAVPVFLVLSEELPNPDWFWNMDRVLLFIATFDVLGSLMDTLVKLFLDKSVDFEDKCVIDVLIVIITIPIYFALSKVLPNPDWFWNIDRVLIFMALVIVVDLFFDYFKKITVIGITIGIIVMNLFSVLPGNHYGWRDLAFDYFSVTESAVLAFDFDAFEKQDVLKACDYSNPVVRGFALDIIDKDTIFMDFVDVNDEYYRDFIYACAICKHVNDENNGWKYVHDPKGEEYYAKASESVKHLMGDCDDHAILLASLVKVIGCDTRIVHAKGHLYPEIRVDKKYLNNICTLIGLLFEIEEGTTYYYHYDGDDIWLNMDYTGLYPGTKFIEGTEEILSIVNL